MRSHKHIILKRPIFITAFIALLMITSCSPNKKNKEFSGADGEVKIMTLNPGHFHAALIQKDRINQVDPEVHVYAPEGPDLDLHLARIEGFNSQNESSAKWDVNVRTSPEYMRLMLDERPGNVVITAGNNRKKTEYIKRSVDSGLNVLSDKPMAIDKEGWELLVSAFESANKNDVLLYDIMTERYNVISILQQRLAQNKDLFGELEKGSMENPAIIKEAVHHLYKQVSGEPLRRPPWYFDVEQQGEGVVDVSTHLIDLAMWGSFPDEIIDYRTDVQMLQANRWATEISEDQFERITGLNKFPDYLQDQLVDGLLPLYSNGDISFTLNGHHTKISVTWDYEAPSGGGDSQYSLMRGTLSDIVVRQNNLYIEPSPQVDRQELIVAFDEAIDNLQDDYPGLSYEETQNGWKLIIPDQFHLGHESHFGKVAEAYFGYLISGELPEWEIPNMITKYYITTTAREMAMDTD